MIEIQDKSKCCGCAACVQCCPKQCISLYEDDEGFLYPEADTRMCIGCGLCEKVCPIINQYQARKPLEAFAAINPDEEVRATSSSGGIFTLLAEKTIEEGGVVFGVRFDDKWQAVFDSSETKEGISAFRGSKYLQARISDSYARCKRYLENGRKVLFSGTPCQIAGLNHFLRNGYPNLITCDVICHGVPSPSVWKQYLDEVVAAGKSAVCDVAFRNKRKGWSEYNFTLYYNEGTKVFSLESAHSRNIYMRAFLDNLILRPSCHQCPAKCGKSHADITIADFWGIWHVNPSLFDDRGTSLILANTEKGRDALPLQSLKYSVEDIRSVKYNSAYSHSAVPHPRRQLFFTAFNAGTSVHVAVEGCLRPTFRQFVINSIKRYVYNELKHTLCTHSNNPLLYTSISTRNAPMLHIRNITFRRKAHSWKRYSVCIELGYKDPSHIDT